MSEKSEASEAARKLSKLGAKKGGRARASVLTAGERTEIAKKAANARWSKTEEPSGGLVATATDDATPYSLFRGTLEIGDFSFECHVLNTHERVLTQREVVRALTGGRDSGNLSRYLQANPLAGDDLLEGRTIQFRAPTPSGAANMATGYDATILVEICDLYLSARDQKLLKPNQQHLARMAETIVRACAKVGIIALIDEATGYQKIRAKRALQVKLQAFIADDMQEWAKMFPDDFWYELARLEGVRYSPRNRPLRWGKYVMAFVYDAIDGDVGKELREINPSPRHRRNHHQWLKEFGREKVNNQIQQVIAIMKLCDDMSEFRSKFARVFKKTSGEQLQLDFMED
ncbi:P63C domain-containing protein [Streptomyces sp. NPDC048281]|uniref:P63C domain-containing protein n=1 Tax=Streptomyces sp. NPDC048281 TaxID=3154715 RepID=UPI0034184A84